jgi:hypothetical protein
MSKRYKTPAALIGALLLAALWWFLYLMDPLDGVLGDFRVYYMAAVRFGSHQSIYDHIYQVTAADGRVFGLYYFYPPFLAQWLQPLAGLEFSVAQRIWVTVSALALLLSGWRLAELFSILWERPISRSLSMLMGLGIVLCFEPTYWGVKEGQVNAIILALISSHLVWAIRGQSGRAGVALGLAALIKMSPTLLLLVPILRKDWRTVGWFGGTIGLALLLLALLTPLPVYQDFFTPFGPLLGGTLERHYIFNFAFDKALLQLLGLDGLIPLRWIVKAVLAAIAVGLVLRIRTIAGVHGIAGSYAALLPFMVLLAPTLWGHHLVWILPSIVYLLTRSWKDEQLQYRQWTIGVGLFVLLGQVLLLQLKSCRFALPDKCAPGVDPTQLGIDLSGALSGHGELLLRISTLIPGVLLLLVCWAVLSGIRQTESRRLE